MEMELTAFKARFGLVKMKGVSYVDGQKVVEGDFQFAMYAASGSNFALADHLTCRSDCFGRWPAQGEIGYQPRRRRRGAVAD